MMSDGKLSSRPPQIGDARRAGGVHRRGRCPHRRTVRAHAGPPGTARRPGDRAGALPLGSARRAGGRRQGL